MKNKKCPKCKSGNTRLVDYMGAKCIVCKECVFDEREQYDVFPEEKKSQKEKGRFTPYKAGGHGRSKK